MFISHLDYSVKVIILKSQKCIHAVKCNLKPSQNEYPFSYCTFIIVWW